jgi:hypothetical protein
MNGEILNRIHALQYKGLSKSGIFFVSTSIGSLVGFVESGLSFLSVLSSASDLSFFFFLLLFFFFLLDVSDAVVVEVGAGVEIIAAALLVLSMLGSFVFSSEFDFPGIN